MKSKSGRPNAQSTATLPDVSTSRLGLPYSVQSLLMIWRCDRQGAIARDARLPRLLFAIVIFWYEILFCPPIACYFY